jgi:hypothetical protein
VDGYLDYLLIGTVLSCAGGNIAHFGSKRLLKVRSGRLLWGIVAVALLVVPVILLTYNFTWEIIAASAVGALIGVFFGRVVRTTRHDFVMSLVLVGGGFLTLMQSLRLGGVL